METTEPELQSERKWAPATVGICHWQTATDRFGPEAKAAVRDRERVALGLHPSGPAPPYLWAPETIDEDDPTRYSIHKLVPTLQCYRNNETALSQAYNLYFVGYQSQIFVYVPRSIARQRLPRHPDCRLRCEPSSVAQYIGGSADRIVPHSINNLTTGFLGREEVVVACCDDGEVYAYYTKEIADWISLQEKSPLAHLRKPKTCNSASAKPPPHFFRENVGVSAWGLAVHRKSRLIAVSSNRREVTVFAFALENATADGQRHEQQFTTHDGPADFVRRRTKDWRIVLALGHHASNLPNLCFMDDEEGEAEKVSAVDIDGFTWIANIWNAGRPVICIGPSPGSLRRSEERIGDSSRGWGVLTLPDESFLTVDTLEELIGGKPRTILPASKVCSQPMADVEPCVRAVPENPCPELESRLDRVHNLHVLFPGQNAFHAVANLLGNADDLLGNDTDDEDMPDDESPETSEAGDETDDGDNDDHDNNGDEAVEGEDDNADQDNQEVNDEQDHEISQVGAAQDANTDDDSDWAGDGFIEEAVIDDVVNQALVHIGSVQPVTSTALSTILGFQSRQHASTSAFPPAEKSNWHKVGEKPVYLPHLGRIVPVPKKPLLLARYLKRPREVSDSLRANLASTSKGYHLVRMYEKDLEMRTLQANDIGEDKEIGIHCPNVLTFGSFLDRNLRPYFRATSRLSMVMHVPELSLVIIGSPIGRVLLLTPTRLSSPQGAGPGQPGYWSHGLRVEWVLPRSSDDICHGQRRRPLHGVAVGPVQDECGVGGLGSDHASIPRRYRLMLHYRNHDIATFEITRQEQTRKLCIF